MDCHCISLSARALFCGQKMEVYVEELYNRLTTLNQKLDHIRGRL